MDMSSDEMNRSAELDRTLRQWEETVDGVGGVDVVRVLIFDVNSASK